MTRTAVAALFDTFAEGEALTNDKTYKIMVEEFSRVSKLLVTGEIDEDELALLQYASMKAGFYAGIKAARSLA